jgi:hypothetical protein
MIRLLLLALGGTALAQAQITLQAPTALFAAKATRATVDLVWTANDAAATSYRVERRTLNGEYSVTYTSKDPKFSDVLFDLNETYVYRSRAAKEDPVTGATVAISNPSNEITVGPPPVGYNLLLATPVGDDITPSQYYSQPEMRPDPNTDPAFAYVMVDPDHDGDPVDSTLYFLSWNRAQYKWNDPVLVGTVGDVAGVNATYRPISLALDSTTKQWAIAHSTVLHDVSRVEVHFSNDGGLTWKKQIFDQDTEASIGPPTIVLAGGTASVVWFHDPVGIRYAAAVLAEDAPAPVSTVVPALPNEGNKLRSFNLALDANNIPALAFVSTTNDSYNIQIGFWRPNSDPIKVADSNGFQDDFPYVRLVFNGNLPGAVLGLRRDDNYFTDYDHSIWFVRSTDTGATWVAPVNVKADGLQSLNPSADLAFGSRGQGAIVTETNGGSGESYCSLPKLARTDDLTQWKACGVGQLGQPEIDAAHPGVYFATNDKLYISFQNNTFSPTTLPAGLVLWREP